MRDLKPYEAWESKDPKLLIAAYEESPESDKSIDKKNKRYTSNIYKQ